MASQEEVKRYLAYWFQLGKKVLLHNGKEFIQPTSVLEGDRYSQEFESCWQRILASNLSDCYLEGTIQSIQQLLTPAWEITPCARCDMPVPILDLGVVSPTCPCNDIPSWPNLELPPPRSPINSSAYLSKIQQRLRNLKNESQGDGN
jgi:hypothetical protein